jgi:hypothetical protein
MLQSGAIYSCEDADHGITAFARASARACAIAPEELP